MSRVNQLGEPVQEELLFPYFEHNASPDEVKQAISLLCEHMKVSIKRTNATKHGYTQIVLIDESL